MQQICLNTLCLLTFFIAPTTWKDLRSIHIAVNMEHCCKILGICCSDDIFNWPIMLDKRKSKRSWQTIIQIILQSSRPFSTPNRTVVNQHFLMDGDTGGLSVVVSAGLPELVHKNGQLLLFFRDVGQLCWTEICYNT